MTSNMITGERKWASARRGGMTVLGKVAVPKPINLPSQRLENHGLDPNVEIVPKGTLSWGSRPSSSGSNAWGTSSLSPRTDGSSSSPKHLTGRPSSGGGTRPSTAGSERASDSNVNAWGSSSRPSSASGALASTNSSSTSLRPRSAETRPGSSQLSRFAEPSFESSGPRALNVTSEQMGLATGGNDGFSLSSGDFPTLGSEKDESRKNTEPLDFVSHGRPGSSSGRVTTTVDNLGTTHSDEVPKGNSWRKDDPRFVDDGLRPEMERWHGDPHPYPNHSMAPHYESWHGAPPVNPPAGVWYRGPHGPPPYGAPIAPGRFPMEPFPYYRPQVPPGTGPHGHHPNNGDMYRAPMPDSYMRPGMPVRPGFYHGPVPYEGYYGPLMGFCNPNERDLAFMGMPPGPPIYNRPVNQNGPDPNNSRPRSHEHRGPDQEEAGTRSREHRVPDQVEAGVHDPLGNYKVLMKQNDGWNQNEDERWSHRMSNREKGILSRSSMPGNAWGSDDKYRDIHYEKSSPVEEVPSQILENNFGSALPGNEKFPESNVSETVMNPVVENTAYPRDDSLIQKIEGLNAKARTSGVSEDSFQREQSHVKARIFKKFNRPENEANSDVLRERHYTTGVNPVSCDISNTVIEKSHRSTVPRTTATISKPTRGVQSRGDHQERGWFNVHEADERIKKSEPHTVGSAAVSASAVNDKVKEHHPVVQPAEVAKPDAERKRENSSVSNFEHGDTQRAKMREIAKQRAIQLQKEEEERIREQKAKALAKLEELNRRSANQSMENRVQKLESVTPHSVISQKQEDSKKQPETGLNASQSTESSSVSSYKIHQTNEGNKNDSVYSSVSYSHVDAVTKKNDKDVSLLQNQLQIADVEFNDFTGHLTVPQVYEASKQRHVTQKQRQNVSSERNSQESIPDVRDDVLKDHDSIGNVGETFDSLTSSAAEREMAESTLRSNSPIHPKRKNKSGKNKHKVEESSNTLSLSEAVPKGSRAPQASPNGADKIASEFINPSSTQSSTDAKDTVQSLEDHSASSHEDTNSRLNNSWKPQNSRKPRSSQSNKLAEKSHCSDAVVWAPVRSNNKADVPEKTSHKPLIPSETRDNVPCDSSKTKRAEMERYVRKPVANELAQQGNIQHSPPSIGQEGTDGTGVRLNPTQSSESDSVAKAGRPTAESKNVDGTRRPQKTQGSWRQRVSAQCTPVQSSHNNPSSTSNLCNNDVPPSEWSQQADKSDESLVGGMSSRPNENSNTGPQTSTCDGWNDVNDSSSASSAAFSGVKTFERKGPSGRGKRPPLKGYKGGGYNPSFDRKDSNAILTDSRLPPVETSLVERVASSKDNRAAGDRSSSQWQPKSQVLQGNKAGQGFTGESSRSSKRETGHNGELLISEDKKDGGLPRMGNEELKRDKKVNPIKTHHNQESVIEDDSAADEPNEQRPSSGYRKNPNYGGRFNRGHESRGDWSSASQENKIHYPSGNRERQRQIPHFEYQPVGVGTGSHNNTTLQSNDSGPQKDNQPGGQRFRERGNNYSRHGGGNPYGRRSGNPSGAGC